ncbi:MAG TPA: transposase domain-containing protein [Sandaracinaceae bacterium LLY-WYZ-13_1]|nr:transposase domain-containing protein [Sandaracinaceae bacterium LLY-WYZ-13_1]
MAQLRKVVRIRDRDASLFAGSDEHAEAAGHLLSLIASARHHELDPERYLRDLIRVLPVWPRERFRELAPKYWLATRARIDARELEARSPPLLGHPNVTHP